MHAAELQGETDAGILHTAKLRRLLMAAFLCQDEDEPFRFQWDEGYSEEHTNKQTEEEKQEEQAVYAECIKAAAPRSEDCKELWRLLLQLFFNRGKIKEDRHNLSAEANAILFLTMDRVSAHQNSVRSCMWSLV